MKTFRRGIVWEIYKQGKEDKMLLKEWIRKEES